MLTFLMMKQKIELFKDPSKQGTHVDIGNGIFAIMYPEDGHGPQHKVGEKRSIKKITIKVSI